MDSETQRMIKRVGPDERDLITAACANGLRLKKGGQHIRLFWDDRQVGVIGNGTSAPPRGRANTEAVLIREGVLKKGWSDQKGEKARMRKGSRVERFAPVRADLLAELSRRGAFGGTGRAPAAVRRSEWAVELVGAADAARLLVIVRQVLLNEAYVPYGRWLGVLEAAFPQVEVEADESAAEVVEAEPLTVAELVQAFEPSTDRGVLSLQALVRMRDQEIGKLRAELALKREQEGVWQADRETLANRDTGELYDIPGLLAATKKAHEVPEWLEDILRLATVAGPDGAGYALNLAAHLVRRSV